MPTLRVTKSQLELLDDALDSYQYEKADYCDRRDGYVFGASTRTPEHRRAERLRKRVAHAMRMAELGGRFEPVEKGGA